MGDGEGIPDVAEASSEVFLEAHQVFLAFDEVVPDAHQALHFARLADSILHEVGEHGKDNAVTLKVDNLALVEHLLVKKGPVFVGHTSCVVEIALQLAALNVYLDCRIISKILRRVVELIEDVKRAGLGKKHCVESCMQACGRTSLMVARAFAVDNDLCLQRAVRTWFFIEVNVNNVASVTHDACRTGELAKSVAHAGILVPRHLRVIAINIVVVANTEELLEAFSRITRRRREAFPSVVLHLEDHRFHVVVEGGEVLIRCKGFIAEGLYLVLEDGAGIVLEQVVECRPVGADVLYEVGVGRELCTSVLDELVVKFCNLEAPDAVGGVAVPPDHVVCRVAMQSDGAVIEDVVGQRRCVGGALDGEAARA